MTPAKIAEKIWHRGSPYCGARDKDREVAHITDDIKQAIADEREACIEIIQEWKVWTPDHIQTLVDRLRQRGNE